MWGPHATQTRPGTPIRQQRHLQEEEGSAAPTLGGRASQEGSLLLAQAHTSFLLSVDVLEKKKKLKKLCDHISFESIYKSLGYFSSLYPFFFNI